MRLPKPNFNHETVAIMGRACDTAWYELQETVFFPSQADAGEVRNLLALRVIAAVSDGERDPERLKSIALRSVALKALGA